VAAIGFEPMINGGKDVGMFLGEEISSNTIVL
jgi:hypothetical protein